MKTFDMFLFEADARRLQVGKAAQAGSKLAGGVSGVAGAAGSLASGNFFGGIWGVLKSTLAAFEGITDTADALSKLSDIQRLHSRLHAHISDKHGSDVADQYVEAVFEADDDIIPLIPPASWDSILDTFLEALNGKMEDYQNLTFTHAIATVLEQNITRVKAVVASKQSKWDKKLQSLDRRYHAMDDFFDKPSEPTRSPAWYEEPPAEEKKATQKKQTKSFWGGYNDMEQLKTDALAMLKDTDLPPGWHGDDEDSQIAAMLHDEKEFKRLIDYVGGNYLDRRLTPKNLIAAAKKILASQPKKRSYDDMWGEPPA